MYDLLILGSLMSGAKSGYKLQHIVGSSLHPVRKVSSGALYPTLEKLSNQGFIQTSLDKSTGRKAKMINITDAGRAKFDELMLADIALDDAKRNEILLFKMRSIQDVSSDVQQKVLQQFKAITELDLKNYQDAYNHMLEHAQKLPDQTEHFNSIAAVAELDMRIIQTKLDWFNEQFNK